MKKNSKLVSYGKLPTIEHALTQDQIKEGFRYHHEHADYVNNIMNETNVMSDVSEIEDKNNPRLWKPSHWNWFFNNSDYLM